MARLIGAYGIFSIGLGIVIITGGIDLSVGSVFALLGVLLSLMLTSWHWPAALAVLCIVVIGMSLGALHGLLITRLRLQPFIVTLCGLLFYRGLARFIANDETKGFGSAAGFEWLRNFVTGSLFGIPTPFVMLIVISAVMWVVLHRSVYGRYLFAVGRNETAARYSGINSSRVIASAYIILGLLAAISAIIFAFYTNSVSPSSHGSFFELYGIAAAVLGGCSLRGGEGSIIGILIGAALLQVLQNLVNLLGIPSSLNFAVMGAVILTGVIADQILQGRTRRA
jgi:ribose transport system permease protein